MLTFLDPMHHVHYGSCGSKDNERVLLSTSRLQQAETVIIQAVQKQHFGEIIKQVSRNEKIRIISSIRKLDPIMMDGLLCVDSWLALPIMAKHPVL